MQWDEENMKKGNNNKRAQFTKEKAEHASFLLYEGTVPRILWYNLSGRERLISA